MVEAVRSKDILDRLDKLERSQWYVQKILDELGNGSIGNILVPDATETLKFNWNTGDIQLGPNLLITSIGGIAIKAVNRTGHVSVKGELVESSLTVAREVNLEPANGIDCIGAIYNAGIAEGSDVWVGCTGIVEVLYDVSGAVFGGWVETSNVTNGRADGSAASPSPAPQHFEEIGHALESASGNTLGKIKMQFL